MLRVRVTRATIVVILSLAAVSAGVARNCDDWMCGTNGASLNGIWQNGIWENGTEWQGWTMQGTRHAACRARPPSSVPRVLSALSFPADTEDIMKTLFTVAALAALVLAASADARVVGNGASLNGIWENGIWSNGIWETASGRTASGRTAPIIRG